MVHKVTSLARGEGGGKSVKTFRAKRFEKVKIKRHTCPKYGESKMISVVRPNPKTIVCDEKGARKLWSKKGKRMSLGGNAVSHSQRCVSFRLAEDKHGTQPLKTTHCLSLLARPFATESCPKRFNERNYS